MSESIIKNNRVTISGEIVSDFTLSHEVYGEGFYVANISSQRGSGVADIIPIMASDRLVDVKAEWGGRKVSVAGQFRSYNKHEGDKNRLILTVFVREFEEIEELPFGNGENIVTLDGFICKQPTYRKTPFGREITDILLAVNRPYGKSDYIPCIAWGRNARFAGNLGIGTHIDIEGRIQSREYQKKISEDETETRTAYETSVSRITVIRKTGEWRA